MKAQSLVLALGAIAFLSACDGLHHTSPIETPKRTKSEFAGVWKLETESNTEAQTESLKDKLAPELVALGDDTLKGPRLIIGEDGKIEVIQPLYNGRVDLGHFNGKTLNNRDEVVWTADESFGIGTRGGVREQFIKTGDSIVIGNNAIRYSIRLVRVENTADESKAIAKQREFSRKVKNYFAQQVKTLSYELRSSEFQLVGAIKNGKKITLSEAEAFFINESEIAKSDSRYVNNANGPSCFYIESLHFAKNEEVVLINNDNYIAKTEVFVSDLGGVSLSLNQIDVASEKQPTQPLKGIVAARAVLEAKYNKESKRLSLTFTGQSNDSIELIYRKIK